MADPVSKIPIRTLGLTDVQIQIADPTTPANQAAVDANGALKSRLAGADGTIATVKTASTAAAATDTSQVVALSPNSPVPAGTNIIGKVELTDGTNVQAVKSASTAAVATDPSAVVALSPNSPTPVGNNIIGQIKVTDGTNIQAVKAASTAAAATDPSAVVALSPNSPTPVGNNIIGQIKITDGTNIGAVKAASTAAAATDAAQVVALSPNSPVPAGTNTIGNANAYQAGAPNTSTNPFFVVVGNTTPGTPVNYYGATASPVAVSGTDQTLVYSISTGKTLSVKKVFVGASVHMRADIQISPDGTTWTTKASIFIPYGGGNGSFDYEEISIQESGTGSGIRILFTNEDTSPATGYASILGTEN